MAESIVEIVLRVRDETGKIIAKSISDMNALGAAVASINTTAATQEVNALDAAFKKLGIRSSDQIQADIHAIEKAMEELGKSSTVSGEDLARAVASGNKQIEKLKAELASLSGAPAGSGLGRSASEAESVGRAASGASGGVGALTNSLGGLYAQVTSLLPTLGALFAIWKLKDLADVSAQIQVQGTVLGVVAQNAGISKGTITTLDKEIQKLGITAKDSATSLTAFIQAGLGGLNNEAIGKAKELARAAQDLAVVSGQNSSETFSRLITNIQQLDTMGLRFMGIQVSMDKAQEKFAASLGKSSSELSEAERKQALMNAALVEAAKLQGTYEAAMGDTAKQISSLPRLINEVKAPLGDLLQPAYSAIVLTGSELLKTVKEWAVKFKEAGDGGIAFGDAVKVVGQVVVSVTKFLLEHKDAVVAVLSLWVGFKAVAIVQAALTAMGGALVNATAALKGMGLFLVTLPARIVATATALWAATTASVAAGASFVKTAFSAGVLSGAITLLRAGLSLLWVSLGPIGIAILAITAGWYALSKAFSSNKINVDTEDAKKQLVGLMEKAQEAQQAANEARRLSNVGSQDKDEQAYLDKKAKEADAEAALERARADRFAKENKLGKEAIAIADEQAAGNRKIAIALKEIESEYDKLKAAQKDLKVVDEAGLDDVQQMDKKLKALEALFSRTASSSGQAVENFNQKINRVLESGAETAKSIADNASKAGLSVEDWLDKNYPLEKAKQSWDSLKQAAAGGSDEAVVAFRRLGVGFTNLLAEAKSPEQIGVVLSKIGEYAEALGQRVLAAKETLKFNQEKAEIERLNGALAGFNDHLKTLRSSMELVSGLSKDEAAADRAWADAILHLGGSFSSLGEYVARSANDLSLFSEKSKELSSSQATATQESLARALEGYAAEEEMLKASNSRKKALGTDFQLSEKDRATQVQAIDKETLSARIENAKKYYTDLKALASEALNNFKSYAEKVKELDKQLLASREGKENDIRELRRKGMDEEQKTSDKIQQYQELLAKSQEALSKGSYEKAKEYATQAKELAKGLGDSVDLDTQEQLLTDAWDTIIASQEKAKEEAKKNADEQLAAYKEVTAAVTELSETLAKFAGEQVSKLLVDIDEKSLASALDKVKEAFSGLTIKINIEPETAVSGQFAGGGQIDGPGTETSDSILAAVSRKEFITRARSVMHYGVDVFHAINRMQIPRDLLRSLVSGGMPRFNIGGLAGALAGSGPAQPPIPTTALELTYNGRPLGKVQGSRDTVNLLVGALKDISRGA